MTKLLIAGLAAAASAVPVIELDMAGITAYRHTEWNQPTTRLQTGQKNGDLTLSNGQVNAGQAPPTGRLPSATGQNEDQSWKLSNPQGGKAAYTAKYDATTSAPVLHQLYRDHDLSYENQKVTLTENGTGAPSVSVTSEAVKSRQDYSERCDAGATQSITTCPFPVAKAYDHATKAAVDVTTRVFRVDVEGETCTNKIVQCGCIAHVEGGGNASCEVNKVDFKKRSTYLFKYDATDRAGNHAEQVVFALILDDVHKPVISLCQSDHAESTSTPSVERVEGAANWKLCGGTTATDNIDGDISSKVVYDILKKTGSGFVSKAQNKPYDEVKDLLSSETVGEYLLTAKVCDAAGVYGQNSMDNCVEKSKDIVIEDNKKPWIELHGEPNPTQECNVQYQDQGASAKDELDTIANGLHLDVVVSGWGTAASQTTLNKARNNVHVTVENPAKGEHTIYYDAKDSANNPADQITRTVNVVDTTKPVIALKGKPLEIIYENSDFVDKGITCEDSCDGTIDTTTLDAKWIQCPGNELKLPLVLGSDDTPMTNPDITACDFDDKKLGTYIRLYRCKDTTGNANWITRKYEVQDNTKPEITVQGIEQSSECLKLVQEDPRGLDVPDSCETYDASRTVEYTDKGATCSDTQKQAGSTLSHAVEVSGEVVNMKAPGLYVIRYDCQDDSGNQAEPTTRVIQVVDHSCPEITMQGDQINYVEAGFPYVDAGATATDDLDGAITVASCAEMEAAGKPACTPIWTDGDTVDTANAFYDMRSCREIKDEWKANRSGLPNDGEYTITTHVDNRHEDGKGYMADAFTHQTVWCDFHSDENKAYTYYMCTGCAQAVRDGSTQGDCAKVGLEMAAFHSEGAKVKFDAKFIGTNQSSEYLCSTNDESNTISAHRQAAIVKTQTHSAEAGTYVITYHVKDSSQNNECEAPKRTVIVRDTLPPVISLHLDKKLIHVSDSTQTGLGDGTNHGAAPVNPAGAEAIKASELMMAEQSSASSNAWLIAAAASAVTGLALLSASSKRTPVSVPV